MFSVAKASTVVPDVPSEAFRSPSVAGRPSRRDEGVMDAEFVEIEGDVAPVAIRASCAVRRDARVLSGLQLLGYHVFRGGVSIDAEGRVVGALPA